jgi:hypothetical protein
LDSESGNKGTSKRYMDTEISWAVYLIVNATQVSDPDTTLYTLKEAFRAQYLTKMNRDFPQVEYYSSRTDGARAVRVAKISLLRSGSNAGS